MSFPSPVSGVPRADVGTKVNDMLLNDSVTAVDSHEDPDGTFTVVPSGTPASVAAKFLAAATSKPANSAARSRKRT
jgi:predicted acyltransferase